MANMSAFRVFKILFPFYRNVWYNHKMGIILREQRLKINKKGVLDNEETGRTHSVRS